MPPKDASTYPVPETFRDEESFAREVDAGDPLGSYRDRFLIPRRDDGSPATYFTGNSLGLQPVGVRASLEQELEDWARLAVDGHFHGRTPWYSYHEAVREPSARLVGARPHEVVIMNSLTVNLHLMMVSFYRPTRERHKILMEPFAFPSDTYAVKTQIRYHGFDPDDALLVVSPPDGGHVVSTEAFEEALEEHGPEIALVMLSGVNYFTGQRFDMKRITAAARKRGCVVGWDLAHAAGNVVLNLHDWNVDFAAWCTYKYLNAGPGAVAGCFVHERRAAETDAIRFGGWWGNDPKTRFRMHLQPEFVPMATADGWQISNPPILALAPVRASMEIFDETGMEQLRQKSVALTGYLEYLIDRLPGQRVQIITPRDPGSRGCQLSLRTADRPKELMRALETDGVVADYREPDVIRVAPVPLYNTFHEVWRFAKALSRHAAESHE